MTNHYLKDARRNYLIALAVERNLWSKSLVNPAGSPYPYRLEKCDRSDPDARPDLNTAAEIDWEENHQDEQTV